tara:strand:+ start:396 stop:659 length:264 start_codon:yes stop_codon:yes gene_type:complete
MTTLYKVDSGELVPIRRQTLANEEVLEGWIAKEPSIIEKAGAQGGESNHRHADFQSTVKGLISADFGLNCCKLLPQDQPQGVGISKF